MNDLLKNSIYSLYAGNPDILDMLDQIQFDTLNVTFSKELYSRISKEECEIAQKVLSSDLVNRYDLAIQQSTLAMTRQIAELLDLVLMQPSGKLN